MSCRVPKEPCGSNAPYRSFPFIIFRASSDAVLFALQKDPPRSIPSCKMDKNEFCERREKEKGKGTNKKEKIRKNGESEIHEQTIQTQGK